MVYSVAIDSRMSSFDARRAGQQAASTPNTAASDDDQHELTGRGRELGEAFLPHGAHRRPAEEQPDYEPHQRAEDRDDHRLPSHARAHLRAAHADRPQQPQLAPAFIDRKRERVRDADQRNDDGKEQQSVDQVHDLVDGRLLEFLELGVVAQVRRRVVDEHRVDGFATLLGSSRHRPAWRARRSRAAAAGGSSRRTLRAR